MSSGEGRPSESVWGSEGEDGAGYPEKHPAELQSEAFRKHRSRDQEDRDGGRDRWKGPSMHGEVGSKLSRRNLSVGRQKKESLARSSHPSNYLRTKVSSHTHFHKPFLVSSVLGNLCILESPGQGHLLC